LWFQKFGDFISIFFSNVQLKKENFPKTFVATEQKFAKKKKHWV
jgi:hypothetical protein